MLHTFKGGYIVTSPKIFGYPETGQRVSPFGERLITSVSFEIYGYLSISPTGSAKVNICYIHREWLNPKVSDNALNLIRQNGRIKIHI